jgi:hypothetical protein
MISTGYEIIRSWLAQLARQMQYSLATPQHDSRRNGSLTNRIGRAKGVPATNNSRNNPAELNLKEIYHEKHV